MKRRVVLIAVWLAIGGLVAFVASKLSFRNTTIHVPLQGEAARNPFYAAIRLSNVLGAEASWERVFTAPPADGVVLLSNWNWTLSKPRRERLQKWVEAGGRLILDDSVVGDFKDFETWSGIGEKEREESKHDVEAGDEEDSTNARLWDADCHKLVEDGSERRLEVCDVNYTRSLTSGRAILWALRDEDGIHAVRTAVGRGSVTVINAEPFRYRDFLQGDHPLLFVTAAQLRRGDVLMFLTEEDHASLLRLVWRFGAPAVLLLLAAVGLALWRASPRFGPRSAPTDSARRSLAEQIRGTGQFALRFGGGLALYTATLRALRDAAIHRLPGYDHLSASERVTALGKLSGTSADELGPAMNFSGPRNPHELREAIAVLESTRRRLLLMRKKHGN